MNIKIKKVPLDPVTFKVDLKAMRRAITRRTCLVSPDTFRHLYFHSHDVLCFTKVLSMPSCSMVFLI